MSNIGVRLSSGFIGEITSASVLSHRPDQQFDEYERLELDGEAFGLIEPSKAEWALEEIKRMAATHDGPASEVVIAEDLIFARPFAPFIPSDPTPALLQDA